ncbi:MAG: hypothetical protein ACM3SM_09850 [Bacteroidota bacterium]
MKAIPQAFQKTVIFTALIAASIIPASCRDVNGPDELTRLEIKNGFYKQLSGGGLRPNRYAIEFDYFVTNRTCRISGFQIIQAGSYVGSSAWTSMPEISPGIIFHAKDTLDSSVRLTGSPSILIRGYSKDDDGSEIRLQAEGLLREK